MIRAYRATGALLIVAAIVHQVHGGLALAHWSATDYFSYFTVLSNLLAAMIFLYGALRPARPRSHAVELLRGAFVLYMLTTGIVFAVLLSGQDVTDPWVNFVVHQLMPVVVVLDWAIDPPRVLLSLRQALLWLSFPLLYVAYTLIRGPLAHWYPYFFIDPRRSGGYPLVAVNCLAIGLGMIFMSALIVRAGQMFLHRRI